MKISEWLKHWHFETLKIAPPFLEVEITFNDADKTAAWELYIELLTRTATQALPDKDGDEKRALESLHELFGLTREIIKRNGRGCITFTKIAVVVLNQVIRPFTSKWHKLSIEGAFGNPEQCKEFRTDLALLQVHLGNYSKMLADIAGVEDLTDIEE